MIVFVGLAQWDGSLPRRWDGWKEERGARGVCEQMDREPNNRFVRRGEREWAPARTTALAVMFRQKFVGTVVVVVVYILVVGKAVHKGKRVSVAVAVGR